MCTDSDVSSVIRYNWRINHEERKERDRGGERGKEEEDGEIRVEEAMDAWYTKEGLERKEEEEDGA